MPRAHLILQHGQQITQDLEPLRQQADALVHLQVAAHGAVDGLQLRFGPHELRAVEHAALQVDVDAQDEELPDLLVDLRPAEGDAARHGQLLGQRVRARDGGAEQVLEEAGLDALAQRVADGEFGHVVLLLAQGDEVVVDARLVLARVVEVEVLRLDVGGREGFAGGELGYVVQEARFLRRGHAPDDDGAVVEEEDFGGVDAGVEVDGVFVAEMGVGDEVGGD